MKLRIQNKVSWCIIGNDHNFERTEDCNHVFLNWTDFKKLYLLKKCEIYHVICGEHTHAGCPLPSLESGLRRIQSLRHGQIWWYCKYASYELIFVFCINSVLLNKNLWNYWYQCAWTTCYPALDKSSALRIIISGGSWQMDRPISQNCYCLSMDQ